MIRRALAAAAVITGILLSSAPARAAYPQASLPQHGHANGADGGTIPTWRYVVNFASGVVLNGNTSIPATATAPVAGYMPVTGTIELSSGGYLVQGSSAAGVMINTSGLSVWAKSTDGATQSSGCVVGLIMASAAANASMTFSSTNTLGGGFGSGNMVMGVLLDTCVPGTYCRVGLSGIYRVKSGAAFNITNYPIISSTRCGIDSQTTFNGNDGAKFMTTTNPAGAGEFVWLKLGL